MAEGQRQLLSILCSGGSTVDVLSLGAPGKMARRWLESFGFNARVVTGPYASVARLNTLLWYVLGVLLCNKLRIWSYFHFVLRTPLPKQWLRRYNRIVCYYGWAYHLLGLSRAGDRVIVDLGDVMADRHQRLGARRWISLSPQAEGAILRSGAKCLAVSDDDADDFRRLYGVEVPRLFYVPPAITSSTFASLSRSRN